MPEYARGYYTEAIICSIFAVILLCLECIYGYLAVKLKLKGLYWWYGRFAWVFGVLYALFCTDPHGLFWLGTPGIFVLRSLIILCIHFFAVVYIVNMIKASEKMSNKPPGKLATPVGIASLIVMFLQETTTTTLQITDQEHYGRYDYYRSFNLITYCVVAGVYTSWYTYRVNKFVQQHKAMLERRQVAHQSGNAFSRMKHIIRVFYIAIVGMAVVSLLYTIRVAQNSDTKQNPLVIEESKARESYEFTSGTILLMAAMQLIVVSIVASPMRAGFERLEQKRLSSAQSPRAASSTMTRTSRAQDSSRIQLISTS